MVLHGMLRDLQAYLIRSGWRILPTKGEYEVLRAVKKDYPRPLLVYTRAAATGGRGYSIDERDSKIYAGWKKNRKKRGLPPDWAAATEINGCEGA